MYIYFYIFLKLMKVNYISLIMRKAFFMRTWGGIAFWNEVELWKTEAGGLLLLRNIFRAFYFSVVSLSSPPSDCKLFKAGSVHVCGGQ